MKEKKSKKTILITTVIIVVFALFAGILFFFIDKNSVYVYTETSGGLFTSGVTNVYRAGTIPLLKLRVPKDTLDYDMAATQSRTNSAYKLVCEADPLAYDKYNDGHDLVFRYGDLIYYHRDDVKGKIYEYNIQTGAIREIVSNHPSSFAIGTDLSMDESAAVLGMLDYYPELNSIFDEKKGIIWNVFYDHESDRLFIEHSKQIYEYLPAKKKLRKVFDAGNLNVCGVYSVYL